MLITFLPSSPTVEQAAANLICLQHTVIKKQQRRASLIVVRVVVFGAKADEGRRSRRENAQGDEPRRAWCEATRLSRRASRDAGAWCVRVIGSTPTHESWHRGPKGAHRALSNPCSLPVAYRRAPRADRLGKSR